MREVWQNWDSRISKQYIALVKVLLLQEVLSKCFFEYFLYFKQKLNGLIGLHE